MIVVASSGILQRQFAQCIGYCNGISEENDIKEERFILTYSFRDVTLWQRRTATLRGEQNIKNEKYRDSDLIAFFPFSPHSHIQNESFSTRRVFGFLSGNFLLLSLTKVCPIDPLGDFRASQLDDKN